jgi:glycosyltransferase involved in cell wall biosynthesis
MFESYGFKGEVINQNCFLDENLFKIIDSKKIYDAIYTARFAEFKRHHLANKIENLALIAGNNSASSISKIPPHQYLNEKHLSPEEVNIKLSESRVGIILSQFEGACYSSSEYLLCGLPVVSTSSYGGRNVWYNDYNSITCESNPDAINEAVKSLIYKNRDPARIRLMHINLSHYFRSKFIKYLQKILINSGASVDANELFKTNFVHKLLRSETPDFNKIFSI